MRLGAVQWAALAVILALAACKKSSEEKAAGGGGGGGGGGKAIKIGVVTTETGPEAILGKAMTDGMQIAVDELGGKIGDLSIELVYEDDQGKPEVGKQKVEKLVVKDKVDIVTGFVWSHVLIASYKTGVDAGKLVVSANAGPSQLAGAQCHPNFFSAGLQNDQSPMALGEILNQKGVKSLYVIAPNYAAGKNMVAGVERSFKGTVAGKDMTEWPAQVDFSAELAKVRAARPDAVFVFYPGNHAGAFWRQYAQAGLTATPLYSVFSISELNLPRLQEAKIEGVLGSISTQNWSNDLDNPANKRFVTAFRARHKAYPSHFAAQGYDTINLIAAAVKGAGGKAGDTAALRTAMRRAEFESVRGKLVFGKNQFPVQTYYRVKVVADPEGTWILANDGVVVESMADPYAGECEMKE